MYVMVILLVANQTQYFALPNPEVPTISDPEKVDFGDKTNNFGTELVMEGGGREAVRRAYDELRLAHPELPKRFLCDNLWFCRSTYCAERWIGRRRGT